MSEAETELGQPSTLRMASVVKSRPCACAMGGQGSSGAAGQSGKSGPRPSATGPASIGGRGTRGGADSSSQVVRASVVRVARAHDWTTDECGTGLPAQVQPSPHASRTGVAMARLPTAIESRTKSPIASTARARRLAVGGLPGLCSCPVQIGAQATLSLPWSESPPGGWSFTPRHQLPRCPPRLKARAPSHNVHHGNKVRSYHAPLKNYQHRPSRHPHKMEPSLATSITTGLGCLPLAA